MKNFKINKYIVIILILFLNISIAFADTTSNSANVELSLTIPKYLRIEAVTSPVLIANITDRTGMLHHPLSTIFRVISNSSDAQKLYLSAVINTDGGRESAMFRQGGRVYIAFGNISSPPTLNSLINCKYGKAPWESPGVVAYPVTSITGVKPHYINDKEKYEMEIKNGTTYINVNVGQNILRNSFASNDPRGAYQAMLMLTESDL